MGPNTGEVSRWLDDARVLPTGRARVGDVDLVLVMRLPKKGEPR